MDGYSVSAPSLTVDPRPYNCFHGDGQAVRMPFPLLSCISGVLLLLSSLLHYLSVCDAASTYIKF